MRAKLYCIPLAVLLTACAAGPAYQRPDVVVPTAWQASVAAPPGAPAPTVWWTEFQNPELNRLIAAAIDGNRDLKAAGSRIAQARALAGVAGADLTPSLTAGAAVATEKRHGAARSTTHSAGVGVGFEPDLWGKNRQSQQAAIGRLRSSEHAQQGVKLALQAEVAGTYFQLLSSLDRLAVARKTLSNTESVLRLLQTQHQAGAISGLELARQQGLVASVKAAMAPLERERQQALDALALLLGRHPQDLALATPPLASVRLPQVAAGLPSTLLEQRPDIRQAEADLVAANADINAARAAMFPSLRLTAEGGFASASLASLLRSGSVFSALAAGLTAPLFDGGRLKGQLEFAQARQDELVQMYQQSILLALREVEDGLNAVQRLAEQAAQQQELVRHAVTVSSMADLRYRNGAVDFATVLDAQRVLLAAQAAQETLTLQRYAAVIGLYRALGGGWDASPQAAIAAQTASH